MRLRSVAMGLARDKRHVADLVGAHGSWAALKHALDFAERPSVSAAAAAVRAIAESLDEGGEERASRMQINCRDRTRNYFRWLPWPMATLVFAAGSRSQLQGWAGEMASGRYGSIEDWRDAELSWASGGPVDVTALFDAFDPEQPLRLPTLPVAGIAGLAPPQPLRISDELVATVERLPPAMRSLTAYAILQHIMFYESVDESAEVSLEQFERLSGFTDAWFRPPLLALSRSVKSLEAARDQDMAAELLERIGERTVLMDSFFWLDPADLRSSVRSALARRVGPGLLKLGVLLNNPDELSGVDATSFQESPDTDVSLAASLISLRVGAASPQEAAQCLSKGLGKRRRAIDVVLQYLARGKVGHDWLEQFVLALLDRSSAGPDRRQLLAILQGLFDQRLTPLADLNDWNKFGLFEPPQ